MGFLFGSKGPSKQEKATNQLFQNRSLELAGKADARADKFYDLSLPFFKNAGETLGKSSDYFSKVMLDPYEGLAPELSDLEQAYGKASEAGSFGPRGGGQVSRQAGLDQERLHSITNLIAGGRERAADKLSGIAAILAQLGGTAASGGATSSGIGFDALNAMQASNHQLQNERIARSQQRWDEAGSAAGNLLALFA